MHSWVWSILLLCKVIIGTTEWLAKSSILLAAKVEVWFNFFQMNEVIISCRAKVSLNSLLFCFFFFLLFPFHPKIALHFIWSPILHISCSLSIMLKTRLAILLCKLSNIVTQELCLFSHTYTNLTLFYCLCFSSLSPLCPSLYYWKVFREAI